MEDENNPLFDLSKIRVELLFLNEKNIRNMNLYENSLVLYLNKYLYKINMDKKNQSNSVKKPDFTFFEFYTKNLNIKSMDIPDTDLLSNKTDFYCNIALIFDIKEKDELINILKNINTQKELTHTLFFCDKNLGFNWQNDYFINLDKNSYDVIYMRVNDIDFTQYNQYI